MADLLGDGVFAFFGAPVMHSDDPERAVRAALDLQAGLRSSTSRRCPAFACRQVSASRQGGAGRQHRLRAAHALRRSGRLVNVAARLQGAAGPGQILVDAATHDAVRDLVVSQDLGSLRLAGKGDWTPTFNILALIEALD